jgi:purine-nucleoside phosphorylase
MSTALETIYGVGDLPDRVLLTPMSVIYEEVAGRMNAKKEYHGFLRCSFGKIEGKDILLAKCHPGSASIDSIKVLSGDDRKMVFSGYCGGLAGNLRIGDIVLAVESYFDGNPSKYEHSIDGMDSSKKVRNITKPSMLWEGPLQMQYDTVDMETAYVYKLFGGASASLMLVSDTPGRMPFYMLGEKENSLLKDRLPYLASESLGALL